MRWRAQPSFSLGISFDKLSYGIYVVAPREQRGGVNEHAQYVASKFGVSCSSMFKEFARHMWRKEHRPRKSTLLKISPVMT